MFFGSARAKNREEYASALARAKEEAEADPSNEQKQAVYARVKKQKFLIPMYEATEELAARLSSWNEASSGRNGNISRVARAPSAPCSDPRCEAASLRPSPTNATIRRRPCTSENRCTAFSVPF